MGKKADIIFKIGAIIFSVLVAYNMHLQARVNQEQKNTDRELGRKIQQLQRGNEVIFDYLGVGR